MVKLIEKSGYISKKGAFTISKYFNDRIPHTAHTQAQLSLEFVRFFLILWAKWVFLGYVIQLFIDGPYFQGNP